MLMLKCMSVYTHELDDYDLALAEIKEQLDKNAPLLEQTVGIIMCHPEFITAGTMEHICNNLPFDTVGTTSASQAVNGEAGEMILTLFIMTSDDIRFKAGITDSLCGNIIDQIKPAYEKAAEGESGQPGLALIFPPILIEKYSGDEYVRVWDKLIPETPLFGMLAIDDTLTFEESETIYNGMSAGDAMPFILCYGNINPRFFIGTIPENNLLPVRAEVTKSTGNYVYEINNMTPRKFFADAGIPESMLHFAPFMIDFLKREDYDGVPVIREHDSINEQGVSMFGGDVDEGAVISLLKIDAEAILPVFENVVKNVSKQPDVSGILLFSCVSRRMVLLGTGEPFAEQKIALNILNDNVPFMMAYAGGEICPTSIKQGIPTNRFHDMSLVILAI